MDQQSNAFRGALIGATAALAILSSLFAAGCGVKQPDDFPAMRLTSPPAADADSGL
jgi:predicted small lipoprotein YifL